MAAPKLKTTAAPTAPQRVLRSSGPVPTSRLKLKGADGKAIQPKAAPAPANDTPAAPLDPEAEARAKAEAEAAAAEAAAAQAAADEEARKAQEEYERQMEEYNRQMEEYNRQMAAIQAEEEARAKAEAEARAKEEEEARVKAEAEASVLAEIEAKLKAEAEAKRRAEEEARAKLEEEARIKAELEAQLKAEADARILAEKDAKLRAAAETRAEAEKAAAAVQAQVAVLADLLMRAESTQDPAVKAELGAKIQSTKQAKEEAEKVAEETRKVADKAGAEALAAARAAAAITPKPPPRHNKPAPSANKPARAATPASKLTVAGLTPAQPKGAKPALKPTGLTPTTAPKSGLVPTTPPKSGLTPAQPKGAPKPAAAAEPAAEPALTPAQPKAATLKPAGVTQSTLKAALPKTSLPKALQPAAAAAPEEAAPAQNKTVLKPGLKRGAATPAPALGKPRVAPAATPVPAPGPEPQDVTEPVEPLPEGEAAPEEEAAPEFSEEELKQRDERLLALQNQASKPPIWKRPGFLAAAGFILILLVVCTFVIISHKRDEAEFKAFAEKVEALLKQGENLNKNKVNTLADAKKAGIEIKCTEDDAVTLLKIIVDPKMKKKDGTFMLGPESKVVDVAKNGAVLLCVAAEQNPKIAELVFKTLEEECNAESFPPALFHFVIMRLAATDIKGINERLKSLAKVVNSKSTVKGADNKWSKKSAFVSNIWESIGMRATKSDLPDIIQAFKDDSCDDKVAQTLSIVFRNIITYSIKGKGKKADKERAECGDQLFEGMPDKWRTNGYVIKTLAASGSTKALAFFKKHADNPDNWKDDMIFFSYYKGGNLVPFLQELKEKAASDPKKAAMIDKGFQIMIAQDVDRSEKEVQELLKLAFGDDLSKDTSDLKDLYEKTEGVNALPDGEEKNKCLAEIKRLKEFRTKKVGLVKSLGGMEKRDWVVKLLNDFAKDPDSEVSIEANKSLKRLEQNAKDKAARQAAYDSKQQG